VLSLNGSGRVNVYECRSLSESLPAGSSYLHSSSAKPILILQNSCYNVSCGANSGVSQTWSNERTVR